MLMMTEEECNEIKLKLKKQKNASLDYLPWMVSYYQMAEHTAVLLSQH
jgi:hypothetical protein